MVTGAHSLTPKLVDVPFRSSFSFFFWRIQDKVLGNSQEGSFIFSLYVYMCSFPLPESFLLTFICCRGYRGDGRHVEWGTLGFMLFDSLSRCLL